MHAGNGACGSNNRNCHEDNANLNELMKELRFAQLWEGSPFVTFSMLGE